MKEKVLDIRILYIEEFKSYRFYVPIKTGGLQVQLRHEDLPSEFCEFLETIFKTEVRRFGENPK